MHCAAVVDHAALRHRIMHAHGLSRSCPACPALLLGSCCPLRRGPPLVVSGGDDCEAKLWDLRQKRSVKTLGEKYQVGGWGLVAVAWLGGGGARSAR